MSSRLATLASTHTTPLESCVRRLDGQMRHPASIAFYLARYFEYGIDDAYGAACRLQARPDLDILFNLGRNFIMKTTLLLVIIAITLSACCSSPPDWRTQPPDGPDTSKKGPPPNFGL